MKAKRPKISAHRIIELLAIKHKQDVFIPECKDGPTQMGSHMRLDAWAMNKSWANPCATGYEVKVSRSDFIQDNKWPGYLPLCNQFYFVAPQGVIEVSELSPDVGLMVVAGDGNGTRLLTKKKAPYRDVRIPEELWRYILMCRVQVGPDAPMQTSRQRWQEWLVKKVEDRRLGYEVAKAIREKAQRIEHENLSLKSKQATYDSLLVVLESLGVNIHGWNIERDMRDRLAAHTKLFDPAFVGVLRSAQRDLESALATIDKMNEEQTAKIEAACSSALQ